MCLGLLDKKCYIWFLVFLLCFFKDVFPKNPYKSGEVRADNPKGCAYLKCNRGDQCVNRKFWCKNPPCPSMLYCSKSRKESLKGPSSCAAVRCTKGFICLVRVRHCRWGEACEQQIARCVTERDYYEGPASCADFRCPSGHRCILRESLCARPPCKLLKSCANTKDANIWLQGCKALGCLSEHECFLRRPDHNCPNSPCKHTPDCSAKSEEELETREQCRGWVCPKGEECSAHTKGPCKHESCRISRSCHKPLIVPYNVSRLPQHSWRDDIKLSFYSKQEKKNSSAPGGNRISSRPSPDKISRVNGASLNTKNPISLKDRNFYETNRESPNLRPSFSRPSSSTPDTTSGPVIKPSVTSLTTWLNHLKLVTGVEAIEIWIKRSDNPDNYGDFLDWLESVKDMLGSAAYDLWLEEVRAMTVTSLTFQKWLPPIPTNRSTDSHHNVEANGNLADAKPEELGISTGSLNSAKYPINDDAKDFTPGGISVTAGMRNDDLKKENVFLAKNEIPMKTSVVMREHSISELSGFPSTPPTIGINEWSQLHSSKPRTFHQAYPFQPNFGNIGPWSNPAIPHQGFNNMGLLNPSYGQFPANWSYQQPLDNNHNVFLPQIWQDQFLPPPYPLWQQTRNPLNEIFPNRRTLEPTKIPNAIIPPLAEEPVKFYSGNYTKENELAWTKYFIEPYETSRSVPSDNFGEYPGRNFGYPTWPSANYRGPSFADVPHRRSKHEGSDLEAGNFRYNDRKGDEKWHDPSDDLTFYYSGFPRELREPREHDQYLHLWDYNRRNLYEKNNRDSTSVLPSLSRNHRVDFEPRLSPPNRYFADNGFPVHQSEYDWTSSYPRDRHYRIAGTRSPSFPAATVEPREYDRPIDTLSKFNPFEVNDEGTRGIFIGDRVNDVPGQTMELPDLWNARYRNPLSPILRTMSREQFGNRDATTKSRPTSSTTPPPSVTTPKISVTPRVLPLPTKISNREKNDKFDADGKTSADFSAEEDDGIYPLLLSLQGYIESPLRRFFSDSTKSRKNSSILPVYTIASDVQGDEDYGDDYEAQDENSGIPRTSHQERGINVFRNEKYDETPDFPDNLKNVIDVDGRLTGDSDGTVKNAKWDYEDDDDEQIDPLSFWDPIQIAIPFTDGLSNNELARGWNGDTSGLWNEGRTETDYYDERIDYPDETVPGDTNYFDPEQNHDNSSLNHEDIPEDLNDPFYDDSDHKTFKKNRPS